MEARCLHGGRWVARVEERGEPGFRPACRLHNAWVLEDSKLALNTIASAARGETVEAPIGIPLTVVTIDNSNDVDPAF